jgi:hypothetical protein
VHSSEIKQGFLIKKALPQRHFGFEGIRAGGFFSSGFGA